LLKLKFKKVFIFFKLYNFDREISNLVITYQTADFLNSLLTSLFGKKERGDSCRKSILINCRNMTFIKNTIIADS